MASRRVQEELRDICNGKWKEQLFALRVPDPENIFHLEAIILCPSEALTSNYIFSFDVFLPADYPFKPPIVTTKQKIWNPRIAFSKERNLCIDILYEKWHPRTSFSTILASITILLASIGSLPQLVGIKRYLNEDAAEQYWEDEEMFKRQALDWAEKDNAGYGMLHFEDLRLAAIQSCLKVKKLKHYECHFFCKAHTKSEAEIIVTVIPSFTIYRESVEKYFLSKMKRLTMQEFSFNDANETVVIKGNEFSRDRCWKISLPGTIFEKGDVDKQDPRKGSPPQCLITLTWSRSEAKPEKFTERFIIADSDKNEIRSFSIHVDPSILVAAAEGGKKPTLPLLLSLPLSSEERIRLPEVIAGEYLQFGIYLLNDYDGALIRVIEENNSDVKKRVIEILGEWVRGRGREVTWAALADALVLIDLVEIAGAIMEKYGAS